MEILTAQQAAEAAKGLTFETVWEALMEMKKSHYESQKRIEKNSEESQERSDKIFKESQERIDKIFKESQERIDKIFQESQERFDKNSKESQERFDKNSKESQERFDKKLEESQKRVDKSLEDFQRSTDKTISNLSNNLGRLGNSLGQLTEALFTAELWKKFNDMGIPVTRQSNRMKFCTKKQVLAEVDLFIENGEYAILVEIKTDMHVSHVDEHLERIEIVRRCLDERNDKRKLLGAVAGGVVAENVLKYAQRKGLYVVIQTGDTIALADTPHGFKPREW